MNPELPPDDQKERFQRPRDMAIHLGDECFVSLSNFEDARIGARFKAARLQAGLSPQEVAELGNESPFLEAENAHRDPKNLYRLTAQIIEDLEADPLTTPNWAFPAIAFGIGKKASEIMQIKIIEVSAEDQNSAE